MGAGPSGKTNHVIRRWGFELDPSTSGKAKRGVVLKVEFKHVPNDSINHTYATNPQ